MKNVKRVWLLRDVKTGAITPPDVFFSKKEAKSACTYEREEYGDVLEPVKFEIAK